MAETCQKDGRGFFSLFFFGRNVNGKITFAGLDVTFDRKWGGPGGPGSSLARDFMSRRLAKTNINTCASKGVVWGAWHGVRVQGAWQDCS